MTAGMELTIVSDQDVIIKRKLVSVENGVFFVCKAEEFDAASREGRDPICIGFKSEYILDLDGRKLKL